MGCILAIAKDSMHANMIAQKKFGFHKNHLELFFSLSCSNISWVFGPSTEKEKAAIAVAERERVAKRTAEEAFNEVFALKKSIRELEGIFNFLNFI